jgi:hypothetical protein
VRERDGDEPSLGVDHGTAGFVPAKRRRNAHHPTADAERAPATLSTTTPGTRRGLAESG